MVIFILHPENSPLPPPEILILASMQIGFYFIIFFADNIGTIAKYKIHFRLHYFKNIDTTFKNYRRLNEVKQGSPNFIEEFEKYYLV